MTDIVAFLTKQLNFRENVAREATQGRWMLRGPWPDDGEDRIAVVADQSPPGRPGTETRWVVGEENHGGVYDQEDADHIHLNDPTFVLADIAAKRNILARHGSDGSGHCWNCILEVSVEYGSPVVTYAPYPCPDLRDLAAPYADHPDYQEEWKP